MKLSVKPHSHTAMNAAMAEVGSDRPVINVERQEFRKAYTTKMVRPAPKISACTTLLRLSSASSPRSLVISSTLPSGRVLLIFSTSSRTFSATVTVLASRERITDMPTSGRPFFKL
jgi:hypothetical protein